MDQFDPEIGAGNNRNEGKKSYSSAASAVSIL